jgi:hypothetical protein
VWDDDADNRRKKAAARDRDDVERVLHQAAKRASSSNGVEVAAILVEVPRPAPSARKAGKK